MKTISTYEQQAIDFLNKYNCTLSIEFLTNDYHFEGDKDKRDIYACILKRGSRSYSFNFGNSLFNSGFTVINKDGKRLRQFNVPNDKRNYCLKHGFRYTLASQYLPFSISGSEKVLNPVTPDSYDILACLQKYDVGSFADFCSEFGYDTDSIKANKTYLAVTNEYKMLCSLFNETELNELQEIQ